MFLHCIKAGSRSPTQNPSLWLDSEGLLTLPLEAGISSGAHTHSMFVWVSEDSNFSLYIRTLSISTTIL